MGLVDNTIVRKAVREFAAEPGERRALEVLRSCMVGELLFDITGSDISADGSFRAGSHLQIRTGTGPGGGRALFAFTRNEELSRLHPPGTRTQSMVTPAIGALELARHQNDAWLYIDPAGPTCAISAAEIDFALRNPHNERLKVALADLAAGQTDKRTVLKLLKTEGPMMVAADDSTMPGKVCARTWTQPDGSAYLFGFTSAPEVVAFNPSDAVTASTTLKVLDNIRTDGYSGIVVNPAGPSVSYSVHEIWG